MGTNNELFKQIVFLLKLVKSRQRTLDQQTECNFNLNDDGTS